MATRFTTWRFPRGASMLEMALLIALIAVIMIAAVTTFGEANALRWKDLSEAVSGTGVIPTCPPTCGN